MYGGDGKEIITKKNILIYICFYTCIKRGNALHICFVVGHYTRYLHLNGTRPFLFFDRVTKIFLGLFFLFTTFFFLNVNAW